MGSAGSNWAGKSGTGIRCIARAALRARVKEEGLWSQTSRDRQMFNFFVLLEGVMCLSVKKEISLWGLGAEQSVGVTSG